MRHNPDLQALASDAAALRARERGAVWDARPTLDLFGGLGGNGLSGTAQDVVLPRRRPTRVRTDIDGGRGDGLGAGASTATTRPGTSASSSPCPWATAPAGGEARPAAGRGGAGRTAARWRAQRALEEEVRAQHRELERGQPRLEIAARGVDASIRQVEIGMIEYRNGRTTAFEVVRLAADLATRPATLFRGPGAHGARRGRPAGN